MIIRMSKKDMINAEATKHTSNHQNCVGFCPWGYSNNKHHPSSGGAGKAAKRKTRGWHKGWLKDRVRPIAARKGT